MTTRQQLPKNKKRLPLALVLLLQIFASSTTYSNPVDMKLDSNFDPEEFTESVFTFGITGVRHQLKSGNENQLIGNAAALSLGFGKINHTYMQIFSLDLIQGPFQPSLGGKFDVDYEGTGISYTLAASAQETNLRSPLGSYGFSLGISYSDIVGRSIGPNQDYSIYDKEDPNVLKAYSMRVTQLNLSPGLFFAWLKPIRSKKLSEERLMTRVEGYLLTISAALPLELSYRSRYEQGPDRSEEAEKLRAQEEDEEKKWMNRVTTKKGQLGGFSIVIAFTALLGV